MVELRVVGFRVYRRMEIVMQTALRVWGLGPGSSDEGEFLIICLWCT